MLGLGLGLQPQGLLGQYSSKGKFQGNPSSRTFNLRVLELGTLGHIVVTAGDPGTRFHSQPNLWLQLNAVAESDYNRVPGHLWGVRGSFWSCRRSHGGIPWK